MHSWEAAGHAGLGPLRFEEGASPDHNAAWPEALSKAQAAEVALVIAPSFNVQFCSVCLLFLTKGFSPPLGQRQFLKPQGVHLAAYNLLKRGKNTMMKIACL